MIQELVTEVLEEALALLKKEFPYAVVYDARLEFRLGERSDHPGVEMERSWSREYWTVQVDNESAHEDSFDGALVELRRRLKVKAQVPERAERLAAILREIPDDGFEREHAVMAARALLEKERRGR
jgi:hypothetical protein